MQHALIVLVCTIVLCMSGWRPLSYVSPRYVMGHMIYDSGMSPYVSCRRHFAVPLPSKRLFVMVLRYTTTSRP